MSLISSMAFCYIQYTIYTSISFKEVLPYVPAGQRKLLLHGAVHPIDVILFDLLLDLLVLLPEERSTNELVLDILHLRLDLQHLYEFQELVVEGLPLPRQVFVGLTRFWDFLWF
jgi:hypothetical protein